MSNHPLHIVLTFIASLSIAACATGAPVNTPSGWPEAMFDTSDRSQVLDAIANGCADRGYMVTTQTSSHVMCERTMDGLEGVFAQALIGNSYSTTPQMKVRFSTLPTGDQIRVQAQPWIETQMAFGQINREDMRSGQAGRDLQVFLNDLARTVRRPAPAANDLPESSSEPAS
ncbi:MAG: hypothetical protein AAFY03_06070 [Pseudomonadota bacterium]